MSVQSFGGKISLNRLIKPPRVTCLETRLQNTSLLQVHVSSKEKKETLPWLQVNQQMKPHLCEPQAFSEEC